MTDLPTIDAELMILSRVEQLERKVAALDSENIAIRSKLVSLESHSPRRRGVPGDIIDKSAAPAARLDAQVTITTPAPISSFKMPTPSEMTRLIDAVSRSHPSLLVLESPAFTGDLTERRGQFDAQFVAAFEAIGFLKRTDRPRTDVYASYHVETAESVLKSFGRPSMTIRGNAFYAACLAHFDVPISGLNRHHEGIVVEIGLHQYTGRPASDQWRKALAGQAPREVGVSRQPAMASPARVIGAGY